LLVFQNFTSFGSYFKSWIHKDSLQHSSVSLAADQNLYEKRQKYHRWYQTSREFKVISTVVIAATSYFISTFYDKKRAIKDIQLEHVTEQVTTNLVSMHDCSFLVSVESF